MAGLVSVFTKIRRPLEPGEIVWCVTIVARTKSYPTLRLVAFEAPDVERVVERFLRLEAGQHKIGERLDLLANPMPRIIVVVQQEVVTVLALEACDPLIRLYSRNWMNCSIRKAVAVDPGVGKTVICSVHAWGKHAR